MIRPVATLAALLVSLCVHAQGDFPSKPLRIVVPYPAGGAAERDGYTRDRQARVAGR